MKNQRRTKKVRELVRFGQDEVVDVQERMTRRSYDKVAFKTGLLSRQRTIVSPPEKILAKSLQRAGVCFETQVRIGPYCVDFVLPGRIIVEVEGRSHDSRMEKDKERVDFLERNGYIVARFRAGDVCNERTAELIRKMCLKRVKK